MGKIRKLPPDVISKIAAGEVIERPCFAVKELIENSIDAGATYIKIEIEESGLKKIAICDNGEGMDEEDLKRCFLPHTTSKLLDDSLLCIQTLGFRGEALSSIAAISDFTIISRKAENSFGFSIAVSGGKVNDQSKVGAPVGTTVIVQNLFNHVPARKKFLKTQRTKFRHILDIVTHYGLSFTNISFELIHNGRTILDLPTSSHPERSEGSLTNVSSNKLRDSSSLTQNDGLVERIKHLLGPTVYENLISVKFEESYLKISGFICKPQVSTSTTQKHYFFINNRKVSDNLISSAVRDAFGSLLEPTTFPIFVLFLEVPFEVVDVNVHPRKEQIAFYDNQFIYESIQKGVAKVLSENNLTFFNLSWKSSSLTNSFAGKLLKSEVLPNFSEGIGQFQLSSDVVQIHDLYLLCQTKQGIAIIDQHAAHERILYEKFLKAFKDHLGKKETSHLEKSILLKLSPSDAEVLVEKKKVFEDLGFAIEQFGENVFKIEAVPQIFIDRDVSIIIKEVLDDLISEKSPKDLDSNSKKMLQYLACRSAIKSGEKLTKQQAKDLIKELQDLDLAYTCPHGRPVKIELPLSQLERLFKRR